MTEPEEPLTPLEEDAPRNHPMMRDSIITYSTDVVDSSALETQTVETASTKRRSVTKDSGTPFYRKKRFWGICFAVTVLLTAILVPLFFFVIFPAIAQNIINHSNLELTSINITNPNESSFVLSSTGHVSNGGLINSKLEFKTPLTMYWNDNDQNYELGTVSFDPIEVKGGKSDITLQSKEFTITETNYMIQFSRAMIARESLVMTFKGSVSVKAMGFSKGGLTLDKKVTLAGANNFSSFDSFGGASAPNITEFLITQNGTNLKAEISVQLNNPSVFSITLGTVGLTASYNGTTLADLIIPDFNMVPGKINLTAAGNITPPITSDDLANLEAVMSAYLSNTPINTTSTVLYSHPDHVNNVEWLTSAVNGTKLTAVLGASPDGPPKLITELNLGVLSLNFSKDDPFNPKISSTNSVAQYKSPFDIDMKILNASQNVSLYYNDTPFSTLITDFFPVNDGSNQITFNIPPVPLNVTSYGTFEQFVQDLTMLPQVVVNVTGNVGLITKVLIGDLTLKGLPLSLNSTLEGFSGFQTVTPNVQNVSLVGGTTDNLIVQITTDLTNPANVSISLGNVSYQVVYNNDVVGTASTDLSLAPGSNKLLFDTYLDPAHNADAYDMLSKYMKNQTTTVTLRGYNGSTDIESLKLAMSSISISTSIPGLSSKMIDSTSLTVQDTTTTGATLTSAVTLTNPFSAAVTILSIDSNVTAQGYYLGRILQDRSNNPIVLPGSGSVSVDDLPFSMNLDPATMFGLLRKQAQLANLDTTVLDALITIGKINVLGVSPVTTIDPEKLNNFDIKSFVETALASIEAEITLFSNVKVGDYVMPFAYSQVAVAHTDSSIVKLIPLLSAPIVQSLVDASSMSLQKVLIEKPTEESFVTTITGQISNTGPLPATISFPNGAELIIDGATLGTLSLPDITAQDNHADLNNIQSNFKISNKEALGAFTAKVLLSDSASWTISAENLTVTALKIDIPGITMQKVVGLKGGSGFTNDITINNYSLPGDAPNGGISAAINSTLTNPSTVGVELGTVYFDVFAQNIKIGEVSSSGLTIAPAGPTEIKLTGRLIPQTGEGLKVMAQIFSAVLAEQPVPVVTKPTGLQPLISWLAVGLTQLSLSSSLPPIKIGKLIPSINIKEMTMTFTPDTTFNPITSSKEIDAQLSIPFGFTLNVESLSEDITLVNGDTKMAKLSIPDSPSKQVNKTVIGSYSDKPLQVFDDAHDSFKSFVKDLTIGDSKTFGLTGNTSASAKTPIGVIPISDIPIDVQTSLPGFKGFNGKPINISSIDVTSGTKEVLTVPITTSLFNPSTITISVGDVKFNLVVNDEILGDVVMKDFKVVPDDNNVTAQVLFSPKTPKAIVVGIKLFENFIMNVTQTTGIAGSQDSTDIESLKDAMDALNISAELPGLGKQLLTSSFITFSPTSLISGKAAGGFTVANPFTAALTIFTVSANITFDKNPLATIQSAKYDTVIPGKSTVTSNPQEILVDLQPKNLAQILRDGAADANIDIKPILPILKLLENAPPPKSPPTSPQKRNTDLTTREASPHPIDIVLEILRSLHVDIQMSALTAMDQFPLPLDLTLKKVPNVIDDSAKQLVLQMAASMTQAIVANSTITLDTALISSEQADNYNLYFKGLLSNTGNIEAIISFGSGLTVSYGKNIELGILKMPPIKTSDSNETVVENDSVFQISNIKNFADFTGILLSQKSVDWSFSCDNVTVNAFDIDMPGITYNSQITLQGFDGLRDVNVTKYGFFYTKKGDIGMNIDIVLGNPSNVGIELGTIVFNVFAGDTLIGPITADGVNLKPKSANNISFVGEVVIKDYGELLEIFTAINTGKLKTTAYGVSVKPPGAKGDVPWLSGPFTRLTLNVPFPRNSSYDNPISAITINELEISFTTETAYDPESSSKNVTSVVNLPLQIPIVSASQELSIMDGDNKVASLSVPDSPVTADGNVLTSSFSKISMKALNDVAFETFIQQLTGLESKTFNLVGSVTGKTKDQTLPPIPFNVTTSLKGLQSLKSAPITLSNILIAGASPSGVSISLDVNITNPSNTQVGVGDVTFDTVYDGQIMGPTTIKDLVLVPGSQNYKATFLFAPKTQDAGKAGAVLLGNFLTGKDSPLHIQGNVNSAPIKSLLPTFRFLLLDTTLEGLPVQVLNAMDISLDAKTLSMNITNALNIGYQITGVVAQLSSGGKPVGTVDLPKSPIPIPVDPSSKKTVPGIPITLAKDPPKEGEIKVDIGATVYVNINGFTGAIYFTESGVTTNVHSSSKKGNDINTINTINTGKSTTASATGGGIASHTAASSATHPQIAKHNQ